jgi:photosystem II stability/assembly factor-like uncharacterized protein
VQWELLGHGMHPVDFYTSLAFLPGPDPLGSLDTLFVGQSGGLYRYPPGGPLSESILPNGRSEIVIATSAGTLLAGRAPGWLNRSTDGGRTWANALALSVGTLFQTSLPGQSDAVLLGAVVTIFRSLDDGAPNTWSEVGQVNGGSEPTAFSEVMPSAGLPPGRLLVGTRDGVGYSDDGGQTWTLSDLWNPGLYWVTGFTRATDASHPFGGASYAVLRDFDVGSPAIYRTDNGGVSWQLVRRFVAGDFGIPDPNWAAAEVDSNGVLWVGLEDVLGGPNPGIGTLVRSADGGSSWEEVNDLYAGGGVNDLAFGRDGRLYAASDRGLWRTMAPVVSREAPSPSATLALAMHPNPVTGTASLGLALSEPGDVVIEVFDVLGRLVSKARSPHRPAGRHRIAIRTPTTPGVYRARAAVNDSEAIITFTVSPR